MIADIEAPGETPFDPLQAALMRLAICCGDSDTVRRCLDEGADPNACDAAGNSPLKLAASLGQTGTCDVLLQYGADPTVENPDVQTTPDVAPRGVEPTPARTSAPVAAAAPLADATLFEGSEDAAAEAAPFERRDDTWPAEPQPIMAPAMPDPAEPEPSDPAVVVELAGAQPALTEPVVVDESFSDRAYRVAKALLAAHPGPRMARAAAA